MHDMAVQLDGGEGDGGNADLSGDGGAGDMLGSALDLDNHVPLKLPPDAVPLKQDGGVDYYEMHVKDAQQQVLPGAMTTIWGFDGEWPGPTIHAMLGRKVALKIFNDLPVDERITIHNHGHNVDGRFDGHPNNNDIPQGSAYIYNYNNTQQGKLGTADLHGAGTYFFHDHEQLLTGKHFYMGIEGFYLIHPTPGSAEANLNLPTAPYDVPLLIQDRSFDSSNQLVYNVNVVTGFQGTIMMVNGTPHPYMEVARHKYRFRMLNASNARRIDVGLSKGVFYEISTDGGLLPVRQSPTKIPMAPAERYDIVIDFAQYKIGDVVTLTNDDASFQPALPEILQFRVTSDAADTSVIPGTLNSSFVTYTESTPAVTRNREVDFDFNAGAWILNGKQYDPSAYEFTDTQLGDVEIWSLKNVNASQPVPHPFHQHLIEFQILDICPIANPTCGVKPIVQQQGWKDTVLVPSQQIVRVKMQFYYTGGDDATAFPSPVPYVFHCHNLEHEDHTMMLQQLVSPSPSPH
jgi:spore coat protein A